VASCAGWWCPAPDPRARLLALAFGLLAIGGRPADAFAQIGWTVQGRVVDSQSETGLANALVTVEGHGAILSAEGGLFRFERVPTGTYDVRVEAFGYRDATSSLEVRADTFVVVPLGARPVELEGIDVTLRTLDFDGRVHDPGTGGDVARADITSDQGHRETTRLSGGFDLDDVVDGPPLRLLIRAFGFLPLDTAFVPDDEERYRFDLWPDPVMTRMIDEYVARLDERAGNRAYEYRPALNRADLAKFAGNASLRVVMEGRYPLHILRRIGCFILDEREYRFQSYEERLSVLEGTFANDLERIELLEFPGEARLFMVRVYTRRFFRSQVGTRSELDEASMVATPGGTFCR
jgi:hypothetical protein